jgi:hypothetical protein
MAYSREEHDGHPAYEVVLEEPETHIRARIVVMPDFGSVVEGGPTDDEDARDQIFQQVLTAMNALGVMTVISATKRGSFIASVTP